MELTRKVHLKPLLFERQRDAVLHKRDAVFRNVGAALKEVLDEVIWLTDFIKDSVAVLRFFFPAQEPFSMCFSRSVEPMFPIMDEQGVIKIEEHHLDFGKVHVAFSFTYS